jgi:hypothetical protein
VPLVRIAPSGLGVALGFVGAMLALAACAPGNGQVRRSGLPSDTNASCAESLPFDGKPLCSSARAAMLEVMKSGWSGEISVALASPVPVYLPTWSPAPLDGMCVWYSGDTGSNFYEVKAEAEPCQSGLQTSSGSQTASAGMYIWRVAGGVPPYADQAPSLVVTSGAGQSVALGHGIEGNLSRENGDSVLRWDSHGWSDEVIAQTGSASQGALSGAARRIISALGRNATPVSGESTGRVVELRQNGQAPIWVSWTEDGVEYSAEGPDTSVFALAASLVQVPLGGCGGTAC